MSTAFGFVYILFNSAMKDLVKIGQTAGPPEERAKELSSSTGVPLPFTVAWQAELPSYEEAERKIHLRLAPCRANKRREFFAMPLWEAIRVAGEVVEECRQQAAARQIDSFDDVRQDVGDFLKANKARTVEQFLKTHVGQRLGRWEKAALAGFGPSQHLYGTCLTRGIGVSQNQGEAVKWFRKAAETGYTPAYASLGSMYVRGFGVPKGDAQAVAWFRKAAEKGYALAQLLLGIMFEHGTGVPKNPAEAVAWYTKAAEQGNEEARKALNKIGATEGACSVPAGSGSYLLAPNSESPGNATPLVAGQSYTIGRANTNRIVVLEESVSRAHAVVYGAEGRWRIRDLKSSNGTRVNGRALCGEFELSAGDEFQIGNTRFILVDERRAG